MSNTSNFVFSKNTLNVHEIFRGLGIEQSESPANLPANSANTSHKSANPKEREVDKFGFSSFGDHHTW